MYNRYIGQLDGDLTFQGLACGDMTELGHFSEKGRALERTLILNASYEPIRVVSWQRAVTLFFLGKVEVVQNYDRQIRSVSISMRVPCIVRLCCYFHVPRSRPPLSKLNLLARDSYRCQYCGRAVSRIDSSMDHVVPRSQGGGTSWANVVIACHRCNRRKGGRTPLEARMRLLTKPVEPDWLPVLSVRYSVGMPEAWRVFLSGKEVPN